MGMTGKINFGFCFGDYSFYPIQKDGKIWIQHISGEGGEFSEDDLIKVIEDFYKTNF